MAEAHILGCECQECMPGIGTQDETLPGTCASVTVPPDRLVLLRQVWTVSCPACGVGAGEHCRGAYSGVSWPDNAHIARRDLAESARWEIVDAHRCTACGHLDTDGYRMVEHLRTHAKAEQEPGRG